MQSKRIAVNAIVAALYATLSLWLPATAFANYRITTSLYALAAFRPDVIIGLSIGNALAGIPQGPIDVVMGGLVGFVSSLACWYLQPRFSPLAVLIVPTLLVPVWLSVLVSVPYLAVVTALIPGQAISALVAYLVVLPIGRRLKSSFT